jgi:hypothetical protein
MSIILEPSSHFRLFSDMHQDMYVTKKFLPSQLWEPEPLPEDSESTLILAGDLWHAKKPFQFSNYSWFKSMSSRFKHVLVVLGNHDFWGGTFPTEYANFERYKNQQQLDNIHLLQDSMVLMGDYKIIGATLWTSLADRSHAIITQFNDQNNDLRYIRWNDPRYPNVYKHISAKPFLEAFNKSKNYIFENSKRDYPEQKIFVISHHPPVEALARDPSMTNIDFAIDTNKLDDLIIQSDIDMWMHGHIHESGKALVGNTTILSNTVGYAISPDFNAKFNSEFNPWHQEQFHNRLNAENDFKKKLKI